MILSNTFVYMSLDEESKDKLMSYFLNILDIDYPLATDKVHLTIFEGLEVENIPNDCWIFCRRDFTHFTVAFFRTPDYFTSGFRLYECHLMDPV